MTDEPDLFQPTTAQMQAHNAWCKGSGWLTVPGADEPSPCLVCKPHLRLGTCFTNDVAPNSRHRHIREMPVEMSGR